MNRGKVFVGALGIALALCVSGYADARGHGGGGGGRGGHGGSGHSAGARSGGHGGSSGGWHGGSSGGHRFSGGRVAPFSGHHFRGSHFGSRIVLGAPLLVVPGYTYAPAYPYYYPPVVAMPPEYIEQADQYRYYCAELGAYFPDVPQCPGQWQLVAP